MIWLMEDDLRSLANLYFFFEKLLAFIKLPSVDPWSELLEYALFSESNINVHTRVI